MSDLNTWSVTGRLTRDAQMKVLASGKALLEAGLAVNTGYRDTARTTFVTLKKWGESGRNIMPYLTKGTLVAASGELSVSEWTGQDGVRRSSLELTAQSLQLLASKRQDEAQPPAQEQPAPAQEGLDDIPF